MAKYDPKRIGVNFSERLAFADGITHEDYTLLSDAIGPQFEKRILSADILIVDFLSGKVTSELVRFGQSGEERSEYPERTFGKIVPGVTTLNEVPGNVFMRNRDGRESLQGDYIIQRGDLVNTPLASTYVLREGETELPPEHQRIWDHAMVVRDILRRNIFPGRHWGRNAGYPSGKNERGWHRRHGNEPDACWALGCG